MNASFKESQSSKAAATPALRGHGELILLVDDDKAILEIIQLTLLSFGYRVVTANDGVDGLCAYARHMTEIKAVITDMAMPVMDGPALIAGLKKLNPAVKMIAATGMASNARLETIARLGVDRILSKPFNSHTLLNALRAALETE
jgi:CheY-like chemotaxis protein